MSLDDNNSIEEDDNDYDLIVYQRKKDEYNKQRHSKIVQDKRDMNV